MALLERIESDYKTALKSQDRLRMETLRLIKAAAQRAAIEKRIGYAQLSDQDLLQILNQQAKQRRETLEAAQRAGRSDVLQQSNEELRIITGYLPEPLSEEALKRLIEEAVQAVGTNQGTVMKIVMSKTAGSIDGKLVNRLVSERLKQGSRT